MLDFAFCGASVSSHVSNHWIWNNLTREVGVSVLVFLAVVGVFAHICLTEIGDASLTTFHTDPWLCVGSAGQSASRPASRPASQPASRPASQPASLDLLCDFHCIIGYSATSTVSSSTLAWRLPVDAWHGCRLTFVICVVTSENWCQFVKVGENQWKSSNGVTLKLKLQGSWEALVTLKVDYPWFSSTLPDFHSFFRQLVLTVAGCHL